MFLQGIPSAHSLETEGWCHVLFAGLYVRSVNGRLCVWVVSFRWPRQLVYVGVQCAGAR
jgi:hypothetical protein